MRGAFQQNGGIISVDLSSLTTVSGKECCRQMFYLCSGITSVLFTNLQTIGANTQYENYAQFSSCFSGCTNLTSITFPKLEKIYCTGAASPGNGTFAYNSYIQKFYFPKLNAITYGSGASSTKQEACKYIFSSCSSLTEIHFGAANQSAIEATSGYSTLWGRGAGNATVYFDL